MKVIVLTGCASTLGSKFLELNQGNYKMIGTSRHRGFGYYFEHFQCRLEEYRFLIDAVFAKYGRIDCLINNAVRAKWRKPEDYDGGFLEEMNINAVIPFEMSCYLWQKYWSKNRPGPEDNRSILNISSIAALKHYSIEQTCYAATKTALNRITLDLSKSFVGVRVNAIAPNSFPSIVSVESICQEMTNLIEGNENGVIKEIDNGLIKIHRD